MASTGQRTGIANLPLHYGKVPPWLFERMFQLAREITVVTVTEFGTDEMLRRFSDPFWFQAFGCVLGYDWHSSGVTTTVCGALKEGLRGPGRELGLFVAGGKGRTSRKTPAEIENAGQLLKVNPSSLVYASRMSAKVDNSALQDGYQLYHHCFFFTKEGSWAVIQQGMNEANRYARRYHWLGEKVSDFVCEPEAAICAQSKGEVLNLVALESEKSRALITQVATEEEPDMIVSQLNKLKTLNLPARAHISLEDIHPDRLSKIFLSAYERKPKNFESLLALEGTGAKTLRALSLISELVYDTPVSPRDPASYSFAHGGKDGYPYPVDKQTYDNSIQFLTEALEKAKIGDKDKLEAFGRLRARGSKAKSPVLTLTLALSPQGRGDSGPSDTIMMKLFSQQDTIVRYTMSDFDIAAHVSRIEANRSVKDALMLTLKTRRPPYRISVTDLLNVKQAYFRRKYPEITPPLEKQQLMWAGTGFHKTFGSAVSSEEYLEQFVEAEGIVGKIDIYEKIPVEVKTTSTPIDTNDLLRHRPAYVEQLGMYCAMVNAHEGEVIIYKRPVDESTSPLVVYHVSFPDLSAIREEMRRRRDLLVQALISDDPSNLPVCPWFDKQCDYSQVCDCATTSVPASHEIADLAGEIRVDSTTCEQLLNKMAGAQPYQLFGINDIVFPRKAYFERLKLQETAPGEGVQEGKQEYLRSMDELGFLDALRDSLRYGAPGEAQRVPVKHAPLADLVQTWQSLPTILRGPKLSSLVERERLPRAFPHYFLRLAFDCALTENAKGRLLLYYVRVPKEDAKLMVYDVNFRNLNAVKAEALRRLQLLEKAISPLELPKCPSWMCSYCDHRLECGEG